MSVLDLPDIFLPAVGLPAACGAMALAWIRQRRTRNAGVVDVVWAGSLGVLALFYMVCADGWLPRRLLIGALAGAWSVRLTLHLATRVLGEPEDGRYADLRRKLGNRFDPWMLWFFQAQALLAVLLSLAFLVPCTAEHVGWRVQDAVAVALWLVSVGGESLADRQLRKWRSNPAHRGRSCRAGLWRYSRHPNYFFEWIHWFVYPVLAIGLPWGAALWLAPAAMLLLVLRVTGIPPTEAQAVRSRGEDYKAYIRTTNAFFPGPPKADPSPRPEHP